MCKILFLSSAIAVFFLSTDANMEVKLKAVKCINFVPEVGTIEKCYVKAISRNSTSLNIEGTLFKPLGPPIYIDAKLSYRYGTITREVIKMPRFEWCSSLEILDSNIYLKHFYQVMKDSAPQLFRKCPFMGHLAFNNMTFNPKFYPAMFPQGTYKGELNITFQDTPAGYGWAIYEIQSDLKFSF